MEKLRLLALDRERRLGARKSGLTLMLLPIGGALLSLRLDSPFKPFPAAVPYFHPAREFKLDMSEFVYSFDRGRLKMR